MKTLRQSASPDVSGLSAVRMGNCCIVQRFSAWPRAGEFRTCMDWVCMDWVCMERVCIDKAPRCIIVNEFRPGPPLAVTRVFPDWLTASPKRPEPAGYWSPKGEITRPPRGLE